VRVHIKSRCTELQSAVDETEPSVVSQIVFTRRQYISRVNGRHHKMSHSRQPACILNTTKSSTGQPNGADPAMGRSTLCCCVQRWYKDCPHGAGTQKIKRLVGMMAYVAGRRACHTRLYSFRFNCSIVSFTAANTNRMFSVSVTHYTKRKFVNKKLR